MMYRKKPVVVEAFKLGADEYPQWFFDIGLDAGVVGELVSGGVEIDTLEGTMHADDGDYIIKGVKGELYPCKPDVFEATYEEVDGL